MESALSIALFLLTNVVFGAIVAAYLLGKNDRLRLPQGPLIITGFALGPFLTTVVLYYALVLWHGIPTTVLAALPVTMFGILAWKVGPGGRVLFAWMHGSVRRLGEPQVLIFVAGTVLLAVMAFLLLRNKPLVDHDVLEYAVQGRVFLRDRAIHFQRFHHDAVTGFHYVGLHGHSFPLLFTWEGLWSGFFGVRSDLWARSITPWYGWLLIALFWSVLRTQGPRLALLGTLLLVLPLGTLFMLSIYHIDSYRILFFSASVAAWIMLLHGPSMHRLLLFSVLCGAQAFIHSIGAILAVGMLAGLLVGLPMALRVRWRWSLLAAAMVLAMGGIHYVADVLFGTGWILQRIIWY